ncbi:hypothetical protein LJR078_001740 [Arthrobacter sp. LjRoot78]|uniref:hypothetical protein n=1 Tax=Arthrobacter sp. LjRoot78 TaxID=3342338 RepID=UPI003ECD28F2
MPGSLDFRIQVLISFQRALWDMVTPPLRGVAILLAEPLIEARFIYEHEPTDDQVQIVAEVETYVIADFTPPTNVSFKAVGALPPAPRELLPREEWIYLRREAGIEA